MRVLELEPKVLGEEVAKLLRVEVDIGAADIVMVVDQVAIVDGSAKPKVALDRNVDRLVPARVVRFVEGPRFGDTEAVGVGEDEEGVEPLGARMTLERHEVLAEHDLDGEEVAGRAGLGCSGRGVDLDDAGDLVGVECVVHRVEKLARGLDVVELDAGLCGDGRVSSPLL